MKVRVTPRAGRDRVDGLARDASGRPTLAVRVSAPAETGKANAATQAVVAEALGVPKRAVRVARGGSARVKTLEIAGDARTLARRLEALTG
ncbi:MAG: DUF167 family protein [Paracoccaceae bacterium]